MPVPIHTLGLLVLAPLPSRVMDDQAHATRRESEERGHDLVKLLLPNDNPRVLKGKSPLWDKHFRQQQQLATARPVRPQLNRRVNDQTSSLTLSPRQKRPASPLSTKKTSSRPTSAAAAVSSPVRCKSAGASRTRSSLVGEMPSKPRETHQLRPSSSPGIGQEERGERESSRLAQRRHWDTVQPQCLLPIDPNAREHVEIQACLLAHTLHLDVDELQKMRGNNQLALNRLKMQRILSRGGAFDDGSVHEEAKRKTTFLLRHFFAVDTGSYSPPQDQLLCDVVEDWACGDHATSDEISRLWKSINNHLERSYLLRRKLVARSDPDVQSVRIAMNCLKKLPGRLPEYRRVLDVVIAVVESGLFLADATAISPSTGDPTQDDNDLPSIRKRLYFEECKALQAVIQEEQAQKSKRAASIVSGQSDWQETSASLRQRIESLLNQLGDDQRQEKEALFVSFLRGNLDLLSSLACDEILQYFLGSGSAERKDAFSSLFIQQYGATEIPRLLAEISRTQAEELRKFLHDNLEMLDSVLLEKPTALALVDDNCGLPLFQRLVDRHPVEFTAILWRSPYLTAHIFQSSQHLVARVLEQNVYRISQVLMQRSDVLLSLLNHTFRENTAVVEEFLLNHPRGLADLLLNRAPAIAVMFKAKPYILSDLLQACRPTLTKVLASTPEVLSYVIRTTPQLLSQIVREDVAVLSTVFASAPQCLGDVLEKHPEFFVNVAHRKPALVSRLFTEHPDLLLEPLEANPALLTTLLVYHRKILPAFSAPDFEPTLFKLQTKKLMQSSTQTCTSLTRASGKLRLREKMRQQGEELQAPLKTTSGKEITLAATPLPSAAVAQVPASVRAGASESIPTPVDIKSEIARMYVAKIAADKQDDTVNRKRQSLANFMQDLYILELGYKHLARKKLTNLLIGAKQVGDAPEATRVKWFRRFLNAMPSDRPLPPAALDFYLLVLQHIIPTGQLMLRLEEELFLVSQSALKTLVDDPLVSRLFDSKEQRQRVLNLQSAPTAARPDSSTSSSQPTLALLPVLCIDDLLDMVMKVWVQYQQRVREEWALVFQQIAPNGTGVAHIDAFVALVRSKFPALDTRTLLKVYHSCGEENKLGVFSLYSEDFTLAMSILQEQHVLRQYATSLASTASPSLSRSSTPPVSTRE